MRKFVFGVALLMLAPGCLLGQAKSKIRLGMYSATPVFWDLEGNWNRFEKMVDARASEGIDLIMTPECYLDGYVVDAKDWTPEKFAGIGQDVKTSPYIRRLRALAARHHVYILFGFTERAEGKLYDAAILVDRTGATVGVYRKTMLQAQDLHYSPGNDLPVFDTEWGKVGVLICADRRWPESARVERLKGARIQLIPSYGMWGSRNEAWMRTRSYENGYFLAFDHPWTSFVADPNGDLLAEIRTNVPALLVADVDLSKDQDTDLHDRRPELYRDLVTPNK